MCSVWHFSDPARQMLAVRLLVRSTARLYLVDSETAVSKLRCVSIIVQQGTLFDDHSSIMASVFKEA